MDIKLTLTPFEGIGVFLDTVMVTRNKHIANSKSSVIIFNKKFFL
jgi:hypothetical protein